MHMRKLSAILLPLVLLAATAATPGSSRVSPGGKATAAAPQAGRSIDLATYRAHRWVVQLDGAPLATYRGGVKGLRATSALSTGAARLDTSSTRSRAYVGYLF